jgi:hypothetical protein
VSTPDGAIAAVLTQLADLQRKVTGLEAARESDRGLIAELNAAMRGLTHKLDNAPKEEEEEGYSAISAPQWWHLSGEGRAEAVARLRAWVETVFRPGYGHLAKQMGPCWEQHDLCLYLLAWLSELHTAIFLSPRRLLTSEADWHTRWLPAATAQMAAETGSCDHFVPQSPALSGADPWAGTS